MSENELFSLGYSLYEKGKFKRAFNAFLKAANEGDTSSMTRVAMMYTSGEGVLQNECNPPPAQFDACSLHVNF